MRDMVWKIRYRPAQSGASAVASADVRDIVPFWNSSVYVSGRPTSPGEEHCIRPRRKRAYDVTASVEALISVYDVVSPSYDAVY